MVFQRLHRLAARAVVAAVAVVPLVVLAGSPADAHTSRQSRFPHPLRFTNRLFPLVPGTQFVYKGTVTDEEGRHAHTIVFTVTDLVKTIDGVPSRVVVDLDYEDGELAEAELAFFAQDRHRNVLTMGEYPEEYENGRFAGAPSVWITGQQKAKGGVLVPGHPKIGRVFVQGRAPKADFYDVGKVTSTRARVCAPVIGCVRRSTVVEEWSPDAPEDGKQLKYYVKGTGLVRIGAEGGDSQEVMKLTRIRHLGAAAMGRVRARAFALEKRAYRISTPYKHTPAMKRWACRRH